MITAENLTKRYQQHVAVDDVSFTCAPGTVTGFLGPNGAGKSTTLRMLTGLTPPTSGRVRIDGRSYADLPNPGRLIGVMLDAAAQHPGRTGLETLKITTQLLDLPRSKAPEMLERVGLAAAGKRRVGDYSLGMRQRLGIASALIGDPAILVLDEPANGMDPEGIRWMRELLRDFASRGGTVLLSSHLLGEVQATVDRLVVIGSGRIVADGSLAELLTGGRTVVRGLDNVTLAGALRAAGFFAAVLRAAGLPTAALRAGALRAPVFLVLVFLAPVFLATARPVLRTVRAVLRTVRAALRAVLRTVRAAFLATLRAPVFLLVVRFFPLALVAMVFAPILLCCRTRPLKRTRVLARITPPLGPGLPSQMASQCFFIIIRCSRQKVPTRRCDFALISTRESMLAAPQDARQAGSTLFRALVHHRVDDFLEGHTVERCAQARSILAH